MTRLIALLALSVCAFGQSIFFTSSYTASLGVAATPTFSPGAGSVASGTVVTISTATSACGSYIYWNTTGSPTTSDTHSTSATVSTAETVYAKVIGCPAYSDSAVGSAAYTMATVYNGDFSGTGALSADWAVVTPTGLTTAGATIVKASGLAHPSAGFKAATEIVTSVSLPRAQYAQLTVNSLTGAGNSAHACILMDTAGNGYCASTGGSISKYTAGSASVIKSSCGTITAGQVIKLASNSSGLLTLYRDGTSICTITDTTWTTGSAGMRLNGGNTSPATDVQASAFQAGSN